MRNMRQEINKNVNVVMENNILYKRVETSGPINASLHKAFNILVELNINFNAIIYSFDTI